LRQDNDAILCIYKKLFAIHILLYLCHFHIDLSINHSYLRVMQKLLSPLLAII
jgi:hypothetical protein